MSPLRTSPGMSPPAPGRWIQIDVPIVGMTCANCSRAVERALHKKVPGVSEATVNLATESVHVRYDPTQASLDDIAEAVRWAGYQAVLPSPTVAAGDDDEHSARQHEQRRELRAFVVGAVFTAPLLVLSIDRKSVV